MIKPIMKQNYAGLPGAEEARDTSAAGAAVEAAPDSRTDTSGTDVNNNNVNAAAGREGARTTSAPRKL